MPRPTGQFLTRSQGSACSLLPPRRQECSAALWEPHLQPCLPHGHRLCRTQVQAHSAPVRSGASVCATRHAFHLLTFQRRQGLGRLASCSWVPAQGAGERAPVLWAPTRRHRLKLSWEALRCLQRASRGSWADLLLSVTWVCSVFSSVRGWRVAGKICVVIEGSYLADRACVS